MRTFVIGDIHGCSAALERVLEMVDLQSSDTLITLGDYVDRGPDSKGVIDRLRQLDAFCTLVPLKGNHEIMMIGARHEAQVERSWRGYGGEQTLLSYAPAKSKPSLKDVPAEHWQFLERRCLGYFETEAFIFVHATLWPEAPLNRQPDMMLFWEPLSANQKPHVSGKTVICGHTAQHTGLPWDLDHTICLDTWVYGDGFLSCLDLETGTVFQASQAGESREFLLRPQPEGADLPR